MPFLPSKLSTAVVLSVVIHGVLLVAIILQVNVGAKKKQQYFDENIKQQPAINARLVIMPPIEITKPLERKTTKSFEKNKTQSVDKKEVSNNSVKLPSTSKKHELPEKSEEPKELLSQPIEKEIVTTLSSPKQESQVEVVVNDGLTTLERSRRYVQSQSVQAPEYRDEYENAGMSIMNNALPQHNYQYIEEKTIDEKSEIKITCDAMLKKTTVLVTGLFGGTLRCKPEADLSKFIKQKPKPKFKYKLDQ